MGKKYWLAVVLALAFVLAFGNEAQAAALLQIEPEYTEKKLHRGRRMLGEVISVDNGESSFTLRTRRGEILTCIVDENTRFRGALASLEDLEQGMRISAAARALDNSRYHARWVFHPENPLPTRHLGRIQRVREASNSFSLQTRAGATLEIMVDEVTRFQGAVANLADLRTGMKAIIVSRGDDDGPRLAIRVVVPERIQVRRLAGRVIFVADDGSSIKIQSLNGTARTINIAEETRFLSYHDQPKHLADLKPGMFVAIAARPDEDGALRAAVIAVGPAARPDSDIRVRGAIVSLSDGTFTLRTGSGEEFRFQVTADTQFISHLGIVREMHQLEPGMRAAVGARQTDSGSYLALVVLVRAHHPPPDR